MPNNNAEQGNKQEEDTEGTEEDTESTGEPEETEVKEQANPMNFLYPYGRSCSGSNRRCVLFQSSNAKRKRISSRMKRGRGDNEEYENEDEESEGSSVDDFFEEQEEE